MYDDGEREELDLSKECFKLLPNQPLVKPSSGVRASRSLTQGQPAVPQGLEDSDVEMSASGAESPGIDESDDDFGDGGLSLDSGSSGSESLDDEADASEEDASDSDSSSGTRTKANRGRVAAVAAVSARKKATAAPSVRTLEVGSPCPAGGCAATGATPKAPAGATGTLARGQAPCTGRLLGLLTGAMPAGGDAPLVGGSAGSAADGSADRFATRYSSAKFSFMSPDKLRDANKRRPDDPDYDSSSCFIPVDWFKTHKVSDGQRQWWEFKAVNWDSVLLFKMGKCDLSCA